MELAPRLRRTDTDGGVTNGTWSVAVGGLLAVDARLTDLLKSIHIFVNDAAKDCCRRESASRGWYSESEIKFGDAIERIGFPGPAGVDISA